VQVDVNLDARQPEKFRYQLILSLVGRFPLPPLVIRGAEGLFSLPLLPSRRMAQKSTSRSHEPTIENRRARHDYFVEDTLECGLKLTGTEIKSVRQGQISLGEGYVRATDSPPTLVLHSVHIAEYAPAGAAHQHDPIRERILLAQKREIRKLADRTRQRGVTLIPLKVYFVRGRAKLLVGIARGKQKADKRQAISQREHQRDMERAMSRRRD
jgi:SsrA-binding protein